MKIREDAVVRNKAIYLALGILPDGTRDILGLWIETTEGAKFWLKVFNDLEARGVGDVLIAVTDGLKGIPEALAAAFPTTTLQTCLVHLLRTALDYASWRDRRAVARALRPVYAAPALTRPAPLLWLALRNITADWGRAAKEWRDAMNQFAILYEERFTHPVPSGSR